MSFVNASPTRAKASSKLGRCLLFSSTLALGVLASGEAQAGSGTETATSSAQTSAALDTSVAAPLSLRPAVRPQYGMRMLEGPEGGGEAAPRITVAPPTGVGLIVGGSLVAALVGLPFTVWGAFTLRAASLCNTVDDTVDDTTDVLDPACKIVRNTGIGLIIPGILGLGGGATMLYFGAKRHIAYKDWKAQNGIVLRPSFGRTARNTQTYGIEMRF